MCVPVVNAVIQGVNAAVSTASTVNKYKETSANAKYQTAAAIANMKAARDTAYEERQKGIEEARKERLAGIQKASLLMAKNAAGGFSVDDGTNLYNQEAILDLYEEEAENTRNKYEFSANKYLKQANNYLNQANQISANAKRDLYSIALTGLGSTTSVAKKWYESKSAY